MTPEDMGAIDAAVSVVRHRLNAEDRFDLRQELAVKLLERPPREGSDVRAWLRECALNWTADFLRNEAKHREILEEMKHSRTVRPMKQGENWVPTWYAPHRDAVEHAWFACDGARMMQVKAARPVLGDVEKAMA